MPKFFIKSEQINENKITILDDDVNHIANVLRMQTGDVFQVGNSENGKNYMVRIVSFEKSKIQCEIEEEIESEAESNINLTIFQGIPKSDKMELIIQKATELGVKCIVPVDMERCVSKISGKDEKKKIERWQKISEVAAKQSGRDIIPKIESVKKIKEICELTNEFDLIIVPYEKATEKSFKDILDNIKNFDKDNMSIGIVIRSRGWIRARGSK